MAREIQTKFLTVDLVNPVQFDLVAGEDKGIENNIEILAVYFKAVSNISETITVTRIGNGSTATFTFLLSSDTLSSAKTVVYTPGEGKIFLKRGDTLRVAVTSSTATGNGSIEIQYRESV